ncbi:hypothetical protein [Nocardioides yefusunii]|uniref:Uncharacterized protein n=1 Tax=Nocardioides yefusunii TaxID=2500546 RepID=A0ABW1QXM9_9ACTN|nr:hypothetical protein [Nocardioides yefusunii]
MLGPLPALHRWGVTVTVLVLSGVVGLWLGISPQVPVLVPAATLGAVAVGALLARLVVGAHRDGGSATAG